MANNYRDVIDVITGECDWRAVVIAAAKIAPGVILKAASIVKNGPWQQQVMPIIGDKIGAIKLCRQITGMTLKDAKDAVEALQARSS